MLDIKHYVGLDLAQVSDYTALVSLRREREVPEPLRPKAFGQITSQDLANFAGAATKDVPPSPPRYYCNIAERFQAMQLGYPTLVDNVCKLFCDSRFSGQTLVIDGTGVGRPVVDLFRKAQPNCTILPVTITGSSGHGAGAASVDDWGYWHVPKKELVGTVQALLGTGRLEVAPGLKHAGILVQELKSFHYKINSQTAHVSYEAWRDREHDDIVLALALAAWAGERARKELWIL